MDLDLRELSAGAAENLAAAIARISPGSAPDEFASDGVEICRCLHTIGAAALLVEGRPQEFFLALCQAADSWRGLLVHLRRRDLALPATMNAPLLGAAAAEEWALAREVARASTVEWQDGEEYEDDFDWAMLLQRIALSGPDDDGLRPLVEKLRASGADAYAPHVALVEALRARDAGAFTQAFEVIADAHREDTEFLARSGAVAPADFAVRRYLWLEGLALLRIADRNGIDTSRERFLYCPPLARVRRTREYAGGAAIPAPLA